MYLDRSIDVAEVRNWCADHNISATINATIYRGRIHHFNADVPCSDDAFLFSLRWSNRLPV